MFDLNLIIKRDVGSQIIKSLSYFGKDKRELVNVVSLFGVSRDFKRCVEQHFFKIHGISLFARGVELFTDELIEMAFIRNLQQEGKEGEISLIRNLVKKTIFGEVNKLNPNEVKSLEYIVKNCRFRCSKFFMTMLNNLQQHSNPAIGKYIASDIRPQLNNNTKIQNEAGVANKFGFFLMVIVMGFLFFKFVL